MSPSPKQHERLSAAFEAERKLIDAQLRRPISDEERVRFQYEQLRNAAPRMVASNEEQLKANAEHRLAGLNRSKRKAAAITLAVCIVVFLAVCAACRFVAVCCLPPQ